MSGESYRRVKGGSLKLKGGLKKKRKQEVAASEPITAVETAVEVRVGTGRVSSSGTVVAGHETAFMDELRGGDALIVTHPTTLVDETRIVTMVLSNVSISLSSAFSTDLVSTCAFRYVSAPRQEETPEMRATRLKNLEAAQQNTALGDYGSSDTLVYRKRKKGAVGGSNGYEIVREKLHDDKSRTELLDMRIKHKSDRHCA